MTDIDFTRFPTPAYVVDERLLIKNLELLRSVMDRTGCKILLAQKGFSMFHFYPLIGKYLSGTTASSLFEARLGASRMGGETHIFQPAYDKEELGEILGYANHIVFNSVKQWITYRDFVAACGKKVSFGLRINPEYSEIETDIYNPCIKGSRFGATLEQLQGVDLAGIEGLHFHTMCEQNSDVLERTLTVVEEKFGHLIHQMKWINFGGGHHITRPDYDVERLVRCIKHIQDTYGVQVYLEPGEAVALNTGYLTAKVLDIHENGMQCAILNTSAACHMPDVLEMPYRPEIIGAGKPGEKAHTYRLGGPTCLAGDVIGDYSFDRPLQEGDHLVFCDMAHYSMVKNNTFNGVRLPAIAVYTKEGEAKVIKEFGYEDFEMRLS